jgi:hypothetical protein
MLSPQPRKTKRREKRVVILGRVFCAEGSLKFPNVIDPALRGTNDRFGSMKRPRTTSARIHQCERSRGSASETVSQLESSLEMWSGDRGFSREAATDCSPRRKPWEISGKISKLPKERKNSYNTVSLAPRKSQHKRPGV